METLVTGGHGAIGRFVVEELLDRGHDVTVYDLQDHDEFRTGRDYAFVRGDITDGEAVRAAIKGHDAAIHLAALKRPDCNDNPKRAQEVNVGGTVAVFEAAADCGTRVVHASTKSVFGHVSGAYAYPSYEPLDEGAPKQSIGDIYALTKAATESYRQHYVREERLDAASVRFASTYGPGKVAVPGKGTLIPDLIESAASGDSVRLSGGDERNDWVYFGDVANGLADAVEAEALGHPVYHIGTGRLRSLREFADVLTDAYPDAEITVDGGLDPQDKDHPMYARMDVSRARADLGYRPEYTLRDGIRDYLDRLGRDHALA